MPRKHLPSPPHLTNLARANRQKPFGPYIVEFCCAILGLVVEIDGDRHAEDAEDDAERTAYINRRFGLRVRYDTNPDTVENLPGIFDNLPTLLPSEMT